MTLKSVVLRAAPPGPFRRVLHASDTEFVEDDLVGIDFELGSEESGVVKDVCQLFNDPVSRSLVAPL